MRPGRVRRATDWLHRWLALIVGVQILLWLGSGLFMTIWPIETVRGEHLVREAAPLPRLGGLASPASIVAGADQVRLMMIGLRPVYAATRGETTALHDARTLAPLPPPDAATIRAEALRRYAGSGRLAKVERLTIEPGEWRGALPVWRVSFDDAHGLRLYFDASTGELKARRTALWRTYDLMWALHIMDYRAREDFSHPLIQVAAALSLAVALSGTVLVVLWVWRSLRLSKPPSMKSSS